MHSVHSLIVSGVAFCISVGLIYLINKLLNAPYSDDKYKYKPKK